jgi:hypothetical protein
MVNRIHFKRFCTSKAFKFASICTTVRLYFAYCIFFANWQQLNVYNCPITVLLRVEVSNRDYHFKVYPEGGILRRNWNKHLKTFAPCYSQSHPQLILVLPYDFLELEIYTATAESGWWLCLHYLFFYL